MDLFTKLVLVYSVRSVCLLVFLSTLSWKAILYFSIFLVSLYFLPLFPPKSPSDKKRPAKTRDIMTELYPDAEDAVQAKMVSDAIVNLVSYDAEDTPSVQRFETIKQNSNCVFARKAKLWGSPPWNYELNLDGNIYRLLPMLLKFTIKCSSQKLDAFLIELPGKIYGENVQDFGDGIYKVLKVISDNDPAKIHCMNKSYIDKRGWVFEFNKVTFFITTFAPFYPENHPRYAFGAKDCYILLQPEMSFAFHDLPPDTTETNWDQPQTVRDKIRVAFKDAGRSYYIPDSVYSPMVFEILRPISEQDSSYEWWKSGKKCK
ncbi:uncharacterized protein LOC123527890 [Mercenaria mercenaria]|uniref:uncharacterized protein LOC123527890 n=1 Tax=Mercenaria mercenaria TaxID=6596 RepID=UPI00234E5100|nr:uncharacterized protein LOC123527890 [Mercenaria mercenaria]XP_053379555.1 uncharacterized protein LOC123527890 [Mercenaria mercenaria]